MSGGDEAVTRAERPLETPRPAGGSGATHPQSASTATSPLEALERDEILRTRGLCLVVIGVLVVAAFVIPLLPGDPTVRRVLFAENALSAVGMFFLLHRTRDPAQYRRPSTMIGWLGPAVNLATDVLFYGPFSPVAAFLVLGIYFLALGKSTRLAFVFYAGCAAVQAALATLVIAGAIPDIGMIKAGDLSTRDRVLLEMLIQAALLAPVLTARISRRTTLAAVQELERAVRVAARREALLLEAREQLERALRADQGRFTGQTLSGYELGRVIGRGGMGEVYEATDPFDRWPGVKRVAIKLLSQASLGNPDHVLRFLRELRTAASIESPHVVKVLEVGEAPVPHLVMERLEGTTLGELLKDTGALSPHKTAEMIRQVGGGITAAAAKGIVHRDLKPHNVFLHGEQWKILDFGVARAMCHGDTLTSAQIVGTPSYMAPEQANGEAVDHRTDLYALAGVAYRCLAGCPPYPPGELAETLHRMNHTRPKRPTQLSPRLSTDVDLVLAIGLARRPADRFETADELATALADGLEGRLSGALRSRGEALVRAGAWSGL